MKRHLIENPQIKTVVLMGFWSTYFREEGPIKVAGEDGETIGGVAAAQQALDRTRRWLEENGRTVILIGPVPVYDKNVPAALAVEAVTDRTTLDLSAGEQRRKHAPFQAVVAGVRPSASFRFLDPIRWLCAQKCAVIKDGVALYRDANHLSVEGAMLLAGNLSEGLALSPGGSR